METPEEVLESFISCSSFTLSNYSSFSGRSIFVSSFSYSFYSSFLMYRLLFKFAFEETGLLSCIWKEPVFAI